MGAQWYDGAPYTCQLPEGNKETSMPVSATARHCCHECTQKSAKLWLIWNDPTLHYFYTVLSLYFWYFLSFFPFSLLWVAASGKGNSRWPRSSSRRRQTGPSLCLFSPLVGITPFSPPPTKVQELYSRLPNRWSEWGSSPPQDGRGWGRGCTGRGSHPLVHLHLGAATLQGRVPPAQQD